MAKDERAQGSIGAVGWETHVWRPDTNYASKSQLRKNSGPYESVVPASIADAQLRLDGELIADLTEATVDIARFDEHVTHALGGSTTEIAPLSAILLRTESASSSEIENLTVGARQLALAELGAVASRNASIVKRNVRTMEAALELAASIDSKTIQELHDALLGGVDSNAGSFRTEQVWIGGSGVGPHHADFVPPHHDLVPGAVDDLVRYVQRDDQTVLAQAAVAHAQFETIHPFTDGNGRTGRALVHAILHQRGITTRSTVPVSAGLLTDTQAYFGALTAYRAGDPEPICRQFAQAARFAARSGRELVDDLATIRDEYRAKITARSDSAAWRLADELVGQPVVNTAWVSAHLAVSSVSAQSAIDHLEAAGVLNETTKKVRDRVWQANDILSRLDTFAASLRRERGATVHRPQSPGASHDRRQVPSPTGPGTGPTPRP